LNRELAKVWRRFKEFSPGNASEVNVCFAPGRVNLIGEHTDYNGGYVLPAALELGTFVFVRSRNDDVFRFASTSFEKTVTGHQKDISFRKEDGFANYPKGVIWALKQQGIAISGADFLFHGNLPSGAGLSSSASIEVVTAKALDTLADGGLPEEKLALLSQFAENRFVGVNCGIMDQFAVAMGKRNHALLLNCDTMVYEHVPVMLKDYELVITNTNKQRSLGESRYNERRTECETALAQIKTGNPDLRSLADISQDAFEHMDPLVSNSVLQKRVRHVVFENNRVKHAVAVLKSGDLLAFGELMNASHRSLRDDFEVSCPELDALVEAAWTSPGCIGSRMTGAGFGGCTVSLVAKEEVDNFTRTVQSKYTQKTGLIPSFYVTSIGDGVRTIQS
jgi:galactokinase